MLVEGGPFRVLGGRETKYGEGTLKGAEGRTHTLCTGHAGWMVRRMDRRRRLLRLSIREVFVQSGAKRRMFGMEEKSPVRKYGHYALCY